MILKFDRKVADRNIDSIVQKIYINFQQKKNDNYLFDLSEVEYIGNQELLVLTGLLKIFFASNINFEISFFKKGIPTGKIRERTKKQIIQIWEVWQIWQIVPQPDYIKYFGIDGNTIDRLKKELNYYPRAGEIYTRNGVTPFISLDYINNYNESDIQNIIDKLYQLNKATEQLLNRAKCSHPFTSQSLSTIITEEFYLNFLDHSIKSSFEGLTNQAFMSISFHPSMDEKNNTPEEIALANKINFETEQLPETRNFFFNKDSRNFKNIPYLEFSFLDFGLGIAHTLESEYDNFTIIENQQPGILQYAFQHDSSRHPLKEKYIPRGLFDVLTIVKRYHGLLIIRSNNRKVLYDFSETTSDSKASKGFGDETNYFPGTLISIYIPAVSDVKALDVSTIKPIFEFKKVSFGQKRYVNLTSIVEKIISDKKEIYSNLVRELKKELSKEKTPTLVFFSFQGSHFLERRLIKKCLYFLLSDYSINHNTNVVVIHPPSLDILRDLQIEILNLNRAIQNYKIHPLPIVTYTSEDENLNLEWLGIYNEDDKVKLNDLLFDDFSVSKDDFNDPNNITGHLNYFDKQGNLISNFPGRSQLLKVFENASLIIEEFEIERLLNKHAGIRANNLRDLYLCNGNYYQRSYVELSNLLNDKLDCSIISTYLFEKIIKSVGSMTDFIFIGITTASLKMLKAIESLSLIDKSSYIAIDNVQNIEDELTAENIDINKKYILLCDVISTGLLSQKVDSKLNQLGTNLDYIAIIVDILSNKFPPTIDFQKQFSGKLISLYKYEVEKFYRTDLNDEIFNKNIVRINPHTNIPITHSIVDTRYFDTVLFNSYNSFDKEKNEIIIGNKFLNQVEEDAVLLGFLKFNNVIHPYFFDTDKILKSITENFLQEIFNEIDKKELSTEKLLVFYPRNSGIENFNLNILKKVLKNHSIEPIEIERFGTNEGWRFPHNTTYLNSKIVNNICLILDDGSCSGDSLIQMIDEIAFYQTKEIVLLCFVGRIQDHKREFFSRISHIKTQNNKPVKISIYFASHWHIPTYYIDDNPNFKEISWINELQTLQNTPQKIKEYGDNIKETIVPKLLNHYSDYLYLPKVKSNNLKSKKIPKKDILLIREEVGKIIGYRLYKESFSFFDNFIKKYHKIVETENRYKEIELLCAVFLYEPYLYDKITNIIPDVTERIEQFVEVLISNKKIHKHLTYRWNKKDVIHLFFIAFKNKKLLAKLDGPTFHQLISYSNNKASTINYILYKLLYYFPLNINQVRDKKYHQGIKELLISLQKGSFSENKEIKKFYNYITTLPTGQDFQSVFTQLKENYDRESSPVSHIGKTSFNHTVSLIITIIRGFIQRLNDQLLLEESKIRDVQNAWLNILEFVNPILQFSISFKGFLTPYPYFKLLNKIEESNENSLRSMVGLNEDIIHSLDVSFGDVEKLRRVISNIREIQGDIEINSTFYNLINEPQNSLHNLLDGIMNDIKGIPKILKIKNIDIVPLDAIINIPTTYCDILIRKEIVNNIKNHADKLHEVIFNIEKNAGLYILTIKNEVSPDVYKGSNGEGLKCLNLLSAFKIFGFNYHSIEEHTTFTQTLTFKQL